MRNIMWMPGSSSAVNPAVALLPVPWHQLGSAMLGWIHQRAKLPGIVEPARRAGLSCFSPRRVACQAFPHPKLDLDALYQAWRNAPSPEHRRRELGELARAFAPLLHSAVRQYQASHLMDRADLRQEAFLGLHEALQSYDPQRGVTLAGFVRWRIIGAVLDARRKSMRQARPYRADVSIPAAAQNAVVEPDAAPEGFTVDFEDLFTAITRGLSAREVLILRWTILEGKTCRQIGERIGLHHARVGQIYRGAVELLRANPRAQRLLTDGNPRPAAEV